MKLQDVLEILDYKIVLEEESKYNYDLVIHSSAVGDYKPEFTFRMEDIAKEIESISNQQQQTHKNRWFYW